MKNKIEILKKESNKNRVKIKEKKHSNFNSIIGLNKGITLVALVVTIIVLIILAGISINLLLGENGIVKKAKDSQSVQDVARILEKLELLKGPILIDENRVDLDTYKEKLEDVSEEYKINYIDDIDSNNAYVVVEGKYKYLLTDKNDGNVEIKYEGVVGELILSETSGEFTYPEEKTFTVIKNESGGALSVSTSNENIATATISENTVTVKSRTTSGTAIITVTSAATDKYGTNKATYEATVNNGTITINATAYEGKYDGAEHDALTSISTNPTGTTIKYKLKVGSTETDTGTTMPKVTGANTYTVSITASKAGYETATKSITVTVGRQENTNGNLTLSATSGTITYPTPGTFSITNNASGGALSVSSSNENIATASINTSTNVVTVTPGTTAGKATITVTSAATSNYEEQTATYEATVNNGTIIISATAYEGKYDGAEHDALTNVSTNPTGTTIKYKLKVGSTETDCGTTIPKVTGANTYTVSITASKAGYETVSKSITVTVGQKNVSGLTITLGTTEYKYDGTAKKPTVTVTDGSKTLTNGTDYTVAYSNNVNVGTATVTITGKGNYTGTKTENYTINSVLLANIVSIGDYVAYNALAYDENNKIYSYTSVTGKGSSHGSGYSSSQTFTTNSDIKWRVLSADTSTGEVVLISEGPIQTDAGVNFYLKSAIGYLYAEEELNRICAIYGHGVGANTSKEFSYQTGDTIEGLSTGKITGSGARSINVEDINTITGYTPSAATTPYTKRIKYPTTKTSTGYSASAARRTDKHTYYNYNGSSYLTSTEEPYKMLFRDIADANNILYWLASRCVNSVSSYSYFRASFVANGYVSFGDLGRGSSSSFFEYTGGGGVRPIVYLKSTVQTSGKDSNNAWTIIDK